MGVTQMRLPGLDATVESLDERRKKLLFLGTTEVAMEALKRMRKEVKGGEPVNFELELQELAASLVEGALLCKSITDNEYPDGVHASESAMG